MAQHWISLFGPLPGDWYLFSFVLSSYLVGLPVGVVHLLHPARGVPRLVSSSLAVRTLLGSMLRRVAGLPEPAPVLLAIVWRVIVDTGLY